MAPGGAPRFDLPRSSRWASLGRRRPSIYRRLHLSPPGRRSLHLDRASANGADRDRMRYSTRQLESPPREHGLSPGQVLCPFQQHDVAVICTARIAIAGAGAVSTHGGHAATSSSRPLVFITSTAASLTPTLTGRNRGGRRRGTGRCTTTTPASPS